MIQGSALCLSGPFSPLSGALLPMPNSITSFSFGNLAGSRQDSTPVTEASDESLPKAVRHTFKKSTPWPLLGRTGYQLLPTGTAGRAGVRWGLPGRPGHCEDWPGKLRCTQEGPAVALRLSSLLEDLWLQDGQWRTALSSASTDCRGHLHLFYLQCWR